MKGIAEITVRDKDGKIKEKRTEHNTITTAHLERVKAAIKNQKYARTMPATDASDFKGIWLHSEQLENCGDIEPVVLCGGTEARGSGVSQEYSAATKSQIEGNDIVNTWVWVLEKSVNIKAISLHDVGFIHDTDCLSYGKAIPQPNSRIYKQSYGKRSQYGDPEPATDSASLVFNVSELKYELKRIASNPVFHPPLYADDEYMQSASSSGSNGYRVSFNSTLFVVDGSGETVRSFSATQFAGLADATTYYCKVMPTAAADWLFVFKSATEVAVYKIPRSASDDTIQLVTTITGTASDTTTQIVSNCAIFNTNTSAKTMFCAHSDGTYAIQNGVQIFNCSFIPVKPGFSYPIRESNPMGVIELRGESFNYSSGAVYADVTFSLGLSRFLHNTILNLSSPIEAEAGDTLTINYTVTVSEGAGA